MSSDPTHGITPQPLPGTTPPGPGATGDGAEGISTQPLGPGPDLPTGLRFEGYQPTSAERSMALWAHLGGMFLWFPVPLIIWAAKRDESPFVAEHAKEALNFQLALTLYYLVGCLLIVVWIPVLVYETVVVIQAAMAAHR